MSDPEHLEIKADILADTYATPAKMDVALERLLDHQRALFSELLSPPGSVADLRASGASFSIQQEPERCPK